MDRKSAENLDRIHAMNWLYEVFLCPRKAFYDYSDEEIQQTALDAVILLNKDRKHEKPEDFVLMYRGRELVQCKDCKWHNDPINCKLASEGLHTDGNWFCADGERKKGTSKCY